MTAEESEALKCINALYLQLPSEVADDVKRIILNLIRSKNEHAESLAKERAVEFDAVKKEITRLQEKYDENGYDCSPMIKLKRIESHVDMAFKIYSQELNKALAEKGKEGASTSEFCQCDFHKNHNRVEFDFTVNCTLCNKPISNI